MWPTHFTKKTRTIDNYKITNCGKCITQHAKMCGGKCETETESLKHANVRDTIKYAIQNELGNGQDALRNRERARSHCTLHLCTCCTVHCPVHCSAHCPWFVTGSTCRPILWESQPSAESQVVTARSHAIPLKPHIDIATTLQHKTEANPEWACPFKYYSHSKHASRSTQNTHLLNNCNPMHDARH